MTRRAWFWASLAAALAALAALTQRGPWLRPGRWDVPESWADGWQR